MNEYNKTDTDLENKLAVTSGKMEERRDKTGVGD